MSASDDFMGVIGFEVAGVNAPAVAGLSPGRPMNPASGVCEAAVPLMRNK